jgi:hypothetical protein
MSILFYDNWLNLDKLERKIRKSIGKNEDFSEIVQIIDEVIQHRIILSILNVLPKEHHREFALVLAKNPMGEEVLDFLKDKVKEDVMKVVKEAILVLTLEIMGIFSPGSKKVSKI